MQKHRLKASTSYNVSTSKSCQEHILKSFIQMIEKVQQREVAAIICGVEPHPNYSCQVALTNMNFDSCQILQLENFQSASWVLLFCPLPHAFIDHFTM